MDVAFCGGTKESEADKTKDPDDNLAFPRLNGGGNKYSSRNQHSLLRLKNSSMFMLLQRKGGNSPSC